MKRVTVATAAALAATMLISSLAMSNENSCRDIYDLAETLMETRQMQVPLPEVLDAVTGKSSEEGEVFFKRMAISAYQRPAMSSQPAKDRLIREFANDQYVRCLRSSM